MDELNDLEKLVAEQKESERALKKQKISGYKKREMQLYEKVRQKAGNAYVSLITNLGKINLEIYCSKAPKTADNFLYLCENGMYNQTIFHRLIKDFMIQGGRCSVTSKFGKEFEDEFDPSLKHDSRGILSMANHGPNTNGSQFFITFTECPHLDGVHTIFGKVVGGQATLDRMERVETTNDRPNDDIKILNVIVYNNPIKEIAEEMKKK